MADGRPITTAAELIAGLKLKPKDEIYPAAVEILTNFERYIAFAEDIIAELYTFVKEGKLWQGHDDEATFDAVWDRAHKALKQREKDESELDRFRQTAIVTWGVENTNAYMLRGTTRGFAEYSRKFIANGWTYDKVKLAINNEIIARVSRGSGSGRIPDARVLLIDIQKAGRAQTFPDLTEVSSRIP